MKQLMSVLAAFVILAAIRPSQAGTGPLLGAASEYLYRMEFDDGEAPGWPLTKPTSKWTVENGALIQENVSRQYTAFYNLGHPSWNNFEVRMRVRFINTKVDPEGSTFFAVTLWHERVDCLPGRISIWYQRPGEKRSRAVHKHDQGFVVDPNHWYDIRLRYGPPGIAVEIDGKLLAELKEVPERPRMGRPLLIYFGNLKCAIDYFRVVDMEGRSK